MTERLIDRLYRYLAYKNITAYAFEQNCGLSNGYLGKQAKGKGTIGSDILEKIYNHYFDLSLIWLITGEGSMLGENHRHAFETNDEHATYFTRDEMMHALQQNIILLQQLVKDKDQIITLLNKGSNRQPAAAE
ncbi:hypothetical protein [Deminuibacter soli]|uniref:XRE family transcriptional regulator n=1 Tax=Deminuibacter soli TaxID=2291815 RepID=A0A3E1NQW5_9BACT|nr:hypothetical protein [Deminuibacter soli]RFM30204.1 hypothetical protein DXN05_04330 [Deminuibacter soli]